MGMVGITLNPGGWESGWGSGGGAFCVGRVDQEAEKRGKQCLKI